MTENALNKYYRQPQIYIKLPSGGKWYGPDVLTPTETGELPVLPMTAKDELAFKTPDALINGQRIRTNSNVTSRVLAAGAIYAVATTGKSRIGSNPILACGTRIRIRCR